MGIVQTLTDPVFNPLLSLGPLWALVIVSFIVSLLVTIIYKLVTNQSEMKRLKTDLKDYQRKMKETRDDPSKVMALQKEAMSVNMQYMRQSLKPTLITFIPIILIFGWLQAHLAFVPIMPGDTFDLVVAFDENADGFSRIVAPTGLDVVGEEEQEVENEVTFRLKALKEGTYFIDIEHEGSLYSKELIVSKGQFYSEQIADNFNGDVDTITIGYEKLTPLGDLSIFGWKPGWLGLYIFLSLIFSMGLRKGMGLH